MLKIKQFAFNPFGENTYVLFDTETKDALVVDPGMTSPQEFSLFDSFIEQNGLKITQIVNTHLHLDHCFGDNYVRDRYGAKVYAHAADAPLGASLAMQARQFGMVPPEGSAPVEIDVKLTDGDTLSLGSHKLTVIHVPGHSPGGIALYCPEGRFAFVGDSIFCGSIGRTDLPGGSHEELLSNLRGKILTLPDDTTLLTGHDRATTVAREKAGNPYLI